MKRIGLSIAALFALTVGGCSDSSTEEQEPQNPEVKTPVLTVTQGERAEIGYEANDLFITFSVENPVAGAVVQAQAQADWLHIYECEETSLAFTVEENRGQMRVGAIVLSYPGALSASATVIQAACGQEEPDPDTPLVRIVRGAQFDISAAENDLLVIYAVDNPVQGETVRIDADADWLHVYEQDETGFSFLVDRNGGEARTGTLTLSYPGAEPATVTVNQAAPEESSVIEPVFSALTASAVTASGATLSCRFDYSGEATVSEAGFCYRAGSGAEKRQGATTGTGTKTAALSGLSAATAYTWYFYAVIGDELYVSETQSFTTLSAADPAPSGSVWRTGWAELPAEDADNSDYYYAHHYCPDFKAGSYQARNYTVCFSAEHHCPVWVAAPRHSCYNGSANRTNAYQKDPDIPSNLQYNSKSTGGGCNKGHMLGSAERTRSTAINKQVFYYTNIAPQYSTGFNTGGGGWNTLEDYIDGLVCADTTYLVIGTYFESYTDGYGKSASPKKIEFGGRSDVSCPTMFYTAVLRTKKGNTGKSVLNCSASELMCAAFVRTHTNDLKGQSVTSREMMSIADLEELTGHRFFVNVPNAPKQSYTPSDWGL